MLTYSVNTCALNFFIWSDLASYRYGARTAALNLANTLVVIFLPLSCHQKVRLRSSTGAQSNGLVSDMHYDPCAAPKQPPTVLPKPIKDALAKARVSWLKNTEVAQLLSCHRALGFEVSQEAPDRPPSETRLLQHLISADLHNCHNAASCCNVAGGSLFLFNRKTLRFFRKDGHSWRKKGDGKTVRETHEKLKVGGGLTTLPMLLALLLQQSSLLILHRWAARICSIATMLTPIIKMGCRSVPFFGLQTNLSSYMYPILMLKPFSNTSCYVAALLLAAKW